VRGRQHLPEPTGLAFSQLEDLQQVVATARRRDKQRPATVLLQDRAQDFLGLTSFLLDLQNL
jgi:hypothetical protein